MVTKRTGKGDNGTTQYVYIYIDPSLFTTNLVPKNRAFLGSSKVPHSPVAASMPTWWFDSVRCPAHDLPAKQERHLHPPWGYRVGIQPNLVKKNQKLQKCLYGCMNLLGSWSLMKFKIFKKLTVFWVKISVNSSDIKRWFPRDVLPNMRKVKGESSSNHPFKLSSKRSVFLFPSACHKKRRSEPLHSMRCWLMTGWNLSVGF